MKINYLQYNGHGALFAPKTYTPKDKEDYERFLSMIENDIENYRLVNVVWFTVEILNNDSLDVLTMYERLKTVPKSDKCYDVITAVLNCLYTKEDILDIIRQRSLNKQSFMQFAEPLDVFPNVQLFYYDSMLDEYYVEPIKNVKELKNIIYDYMESEGF